MKKLEGGTQTYQHKIDLAANETRRIGNHRNEFRIQIRYREHKKSISCQKFVEKWALNRLGKVIDIVPPRAIRLLYWAFNFVLKQVIENFDDKIGYKKLVILLSIVFIDPDNQFIANL